MGERVLDTTNNGTQETVTIGSQKLTAGVVRREHFIEVAYPAGPRPEQGALISIGADEHTVLSVESSPYVRGFVVLKVK